MPRRPFPTLPSTVLKFTSRLRAATITSSEEKENSWWWRRSLTLLLRRLHLGLIRIPKVVHNLLHRADGGCGPSCATQPAGDRPSSQICRCDSLTGDTTPDHHTGPGKLRESKKNVSPMGPRAKMYKFPPSTCQTRKTDLTFARNLDNWKVILPTRNNNQRCLTVLHSKPKRTISWCKNSNFAAYTSTIKNKKQPDTETFCNCGTLGDDVRASLGCPDGCTLGTVVMRLTERSYDICWQSHGESHTHIMAQM